MALILRSFKMLFDKGGNPVLTNQKIITKWKTTEDLGFDIASPLAAKKFLEKLHLPNGKLLPHQTKYGDPIVYELYFWGKLKPWMQELFPEELQDKKRMTVFPGYDTEGNKLDLKRYGRIRT